MVLNGPMLYLWSSFPINTLICKPLVYVFGEGSPNKMRAFTEELVQQAFVDAYDKAKDSDEMTKIAKHLLKCMILILMIMKYQEPIMLYSNLILIWILNLIIWLKLKSTNGEYTIEIGGNDVALINYLKFRIGRKDIEF